MLKNQTKKNDSQNDLQASEANIEFSKDEDLNRNRTVNATVFIQNATDFISTIEISGLPGLRLNLDNQLIQLFDFNVIKPRSYALICTQNTEKHSDQPRRIYEYGNRQNGDFLVHFQNEYVNASRAKTPKITFDFEDLTVKISNVVIVSDVSGAHCGFPTSECHCLLILTRFHFFHSVTMGHHFCEPSSTVQTSITSNSLWFRSKAIFYAFDYFWYQHLN